MSSGLSLVFLTVDASDHCLLQLKIILLTSVKLKSLQTASFLVVLEDQFDHSENFARPLMAFSGGLQSQSSFDNLQFHCCVVFFAFFAAMCWSNLKEEIYPESNLKRLEI